MKRLALLLMLMAFALPNSFGKKVEEKMVPQYQIEGAGMTSQNAQQVLIKILAKDKNKVSDADLEKAAVHGVLFRDYDDTTNSGYGSVASHKAIMGSPTAEVEYVDFFKNFFDNNDYRNYVQIVGDSRRVVKVGKEWKVSAVVKVNSAALKKMLKQQGMVKDLGGGW